MKLHGAADELMITGMLMQAEELGVDINSRQFRKLFYQTVYPNIKQRRENNIQTWKSEANRNFEQNRTKKLDKIIVDTLQPYDANTNTAIDVVTLVDTIQNTMNFDTRKEATDYLFSRVAAQVDSDQPQLDISHLNYLFNDALHKHDGNGGKLYKYADGPFGGKDANASLIQKLETKLALETDRAITANKKIAQQEIDDLNRQYNGQPPQGLLQKKLEELENRYPNIDVRSLQTGAKSVTNGGGYPNAGQGDPDIDFLAEIQSVFNIPVKDLSIDQQVQIQRAYGDFKALVKNQTDNGIDPLKAQRLFLPQVKESLLAGKYSDSSVEARLGKDVRSQDINADRAYIETDFNKVSNQGDFVSIHEKQALSDLKRHYLYGEPFPSYFYGVTRGTNQSPYQYADDRFRAMGGYDENNAIAERFVTRNGVLVDPQFGLTKAELNELEAKPHLTKTYTKILEPEKGKAILEGFKTGNDVGSFDSAIGPKKRGADKLTIGELLVFGDRGASNFGLYGLSAQELKDAVRFLPPSFKDKLFTEETQSFLVLELIRQRANRTNSIRGAIIQAKKGGEATVFQGDEKEGSWDRLISLDPDEQNALLDIFPQLRNIPMNQFQNLTPGVVLGLQSEIQNYQRNREQRIERLKNTNKKKEPTTIEELKEVPAVKKSREGR